MVDFFDWIKKNRIKITKIVITIIVIYFLFCSLMQLIFEFTRNLFQTLTIIYVILLIICNLLSEFSPYVLHNYLLFTFPFLSNYLGRGVVYILIGLLYLSPELSNTMNWAGYSIIAVGLICIWLNFHISIAFILWFVSLWQREYQIRLADGYDPVIHGCNAFAICPNTV